MLTTLTYGNPFGNEADKFSPLKRDIKNEHDITPTLYYYEKKIHLLHHLR